MHATDKNKGKVKHKKKMMVERVRKLAKQIYGRRELRPEETATANGPFRE